MENYHIAVFDIGKTNKKLLIYDQDLNLKAESSSQIDLIDNNGVQEENVAAIFDWYIAQLKMMVPDYNIKAISISTHGATLSALDGDGNLAVPVISYTTEPGEDFHKKFYEEFGDKKELQSITATAEFKALISIGKTIFYIRETFPDKFRNIKHLLNYPQYFGFLLTGKHGIEKTYLGCHTYLWDYQKNDWSSVAKSLNVDHMFPQTFLTPWDILGKIREEISEKTGLPKDTIVTTGIHDSNAALLPYVIAGFENFILNSTGTWCVVMHPQEEVAFKEEELGKTVFYNTSAFGKPVKTAIFMGGQEFAEYEELIKNTYGNHEPPEYDQELFEKIIHERRWFILPSVVKGAGQFPDSIARIVIDDQVYPLSDIKSGRIKHMMFENHKTFYNVLNLSLALQTEVALKRAGIKKGMKVFIEGGFRKNKSYKWLLSGLFPESEISLTKLIEASALGAAILGKSAIEQKDPTALRNLINIQSEPVGKISLPGIELYKKKFLDLIDRQ
jgi:L-fuculokinase